jgi:hypothetical protein
MRPSSHKLAHALAARLSAVLPPPYSARAADAAVAVFAGEQLCGILGAPSFLDDADDEPAETRIESIADAVLSGVQDYVADDSTEPWPREADGEMAMPGARVDGAALHLWFGRDESAPAVALRPIQFSELVE